MINLDLSINIRNYKSIVDTNLLLKKGVNILIGPNGSGKTCLLNALKFLSDLAIDGVGQAVAKNGGPKRVYHRGKERISFTIRYDYDKRIYKKRQAEHYFEWQIEIEQKGKEPVATIIRENLSIFAIKRNEDKVFEIEINRENLKNITHKLFLSKEDIGKDFFYFWHNIGKNKAELITIFINDINSSIEEFKRNPDNSILEFISFYDSKIEELLLSFQRLSEYNIIPQIARGENDSLPFSEMKPNGEGLSNVIFSLENRNYEKITNSRTFGSYSKRDYNRILLLFPHRRSLGRKNIKLNSALENINEELSKAVRPIIAVTTGINQSNGKRFVVFKTSNNMKFYPDEVSDGTIKWLCILVSIYIPFSDLYIIEEPENYLHPWMQQRLITLMRKQAKQYSTLFLITTHSPTLLNTLLPEEVIVIRSSENGTIATNITHKDDIYEILQDNDFGLGDLWVSGAIGGIPGDE